MTKKVRRILRRRKKKIQRRLDKKLSWPKEPGPVFSSSNMGYEMGDRVIATHAGGIGAIHTMVRRLGFVRAIDSNLSLLKIHMPYHESDHVLNIAYNLLAGGTCLEDLERRRQDEAYMNALGAVRIPDPTTAGDFLRRFDPSSVTELMDLTNEVRKKVWRQQPKAFRRLAIIEADGTLAPTEGEKKAGMDVTYKGDWGYHPLILSLANTQEPLFLANRSGNVPSHTDAGPWFDKAIDLCEEVFDEVRLRGDTDFSLTGRFDGWSERGTKFVFGYDAHLNLKKKAEELPPSAWTPLFRPEDTVPLHKQRHKRENTKERRVIERGFETIRLLEEELAEFEYRPTKCKRSYRMIVLKKTLAVERGEPLLIPNNVRFFFYVTNDDSLSQEEVVFEANQRCNQENLIEQLKNEVHAMRAPVYDLNSNWAYMVIASLAWTFKAWFAMTQPRQPDRGALLRMEFKRFLSSVICIPGQVIKAARRIRIRLLCYSEGLRLLFSSLKGTAAYRFR